MEVILSTVLNIIYALLILSVLVFVHELGHFMAARSIKLPVITFSIGMGPALKKWRWKRFGDTEFRISAIPFGGYCMVSGEEEETEEKGSFFSKTPWQRIWYASAGVLMNFALAVLIYIIIFAGWGLPVGIDNTNQVSLVLLDKPAMEAGIQPKDRLLIIDGEYINSYTELAEIVNANPGKEIEFLVGTPVRESVEISIHRDIEVAMNLDEKVLLKDINFESITFADTLLFGLGENTRTFKLNDEDKPGSLVKLQDLTEIENSDYEGTLVAIENLKTINGEPVPLTDGNEINWIEVGNIISAERGAILLSFSESIDTREIKITPDGNADGKGIIGVIPWTDYEPVGFLKAIGLAFYSLWKMLGLILVFFGGLFKGQAGDVAGPVGIVRIAGQMSRLGFASILSFTAMLSINLGFINLIPFPGLDGGHIVFNLFEGITRKKIKRNVLNTINYIGFMLLMGLMVLVIVRDVLNFF